MSVAGWAAQFGGPGNDWTPYVAVDSAGGVYATERLSGTVVVNGNGNSNITLTSEGGFDGAVVKYNPNGSLAWARRMGGTLNDLAYGIVVDGSGNLYVTGYFQGTADFGSTTLTSAGGNDVFLTKLDAATGNFLWAERMGGTGGDAGVGLALDSGGNLYLCGSFSNTASFGGIILTNPHQVGYTPIGFVAKVDAGTGNVQWAQKLGGMTSGLAVDGAGNIDVNGGSFVVDMDAVSGQVLWTTGLGKGAISVIGGGIAATSGAVYVTGSFQGTGSFGTTKLTSSTNPNGNTNHDAFVTSLSTTTGAVSWAKAFGDSTLISGTANGVAVDSGGTLSVSGTLSSSGTFLERMDASGNVVTTWQDSATGDFQASRVAVDSGGVVYVTGGFMNTATLNTGSGSVTLTSAGSYDGFLLKRDPQASRSVAQPLMSTVPSPSLSRASVLQVTSRQALATSSPINPQPTLIPLAPLSDQDLTQLAAELIHSGTKRTRLSFWG